MHTLGNVLQTQHLCGVEAKEHDYSELPVVLWQARISGGTFYQLAVISYHL